MHHRQLLRIYIIFYTSDIETLFLFI